MSDQSEAKNPEFDHDDLSVPAENANYNFDVDVDAANDVQEPVNITKEELRQLENELLFYT
jgi:timeless